MSDFGSRWEAAYLRHLQGTIQESEAAQGLLLRRRQLQAQEAAPYLEEGLQGIQQYAFDPHLSTFAAAQIARGYEIMGRRAPDTAQMLAREQKRQIFAYLGQVQNQARVIGADLSDQVPAGGGPTPRQAWLQQRHQEAMAQFGQYWPDFLSTIGNSAALSGAGATAPAGDIAAAPGQGVPSAPGADPGNHSDILWGLVGPAFGTYAKGASELESGLSGLQRLAESGYHTPEEIAAAAKPFQPLVAGDPVLKAKLDSVLAAGARQRTGENSQAYRIWAQEDPSRMVTDPQTGQPRPKRILEFDTTPNPKWGGLSPRDQADHFANGGNITSWEAAVRTLQAAQARQTAQDRAAADRAAARADRAAKEQAKAQQHKRAKAGAPHAPRQAPAGREPGLAALAGLTPRQFARKRRFQPGAKRSDTWEKLKAAGLSDQQAADAMGGK